MISEYFEGFKVLALNAIFNPLLGGLLLLLFFIGRYFGKLTKGLKIWKLLLFGYFGIFLFPAVHDAGPFLGGIVVLGILSNHVGTVLSIFSWAGNLGDVIFGFRHRNAFEDIIRREKELAERERKLKEAERRRAYEERARSQQQSRDWQDEAKGFRQRSKKKAQQGSGYQKKNDKKSQKRYYYSNNYRKFAYSAKYAEEKRARYLNILELDPSRSYNPDELKAAYRKKVKKTHPDAGGSQAEFIEVLNAYEWLR